MSAIAYITMVDGKLTRDSTVTVREDGVEVAHTSVPERGHDGGRNQAHRVLSVLMDLGWQTVGREDQLRMTSDGEELDVEPLREEWTTR